MTERLPFDPDNPGLSGAYTQAPRPRDPRCTGACTSPDRPSYDSPAKTGQERGTGRKVVYCPCCQHELTRLPEAGLQNERPANLNPGLVAGRFVRFADEICSYEVVLLWDVKVAP